MPMGVSKPRFARGTRLPAARFLPIVISETVSVPTGRVSVLNLAARPDPACWRLLPSRYAFANLRRGWVKKTVRGDARRCGRCWSKTIRTTRSWSSWSSAAAARTDRPAGADGRPDDRGARREHLGRDHFGLLPADVRRARGVLAGAREEFGHSVHRRFGHGGRGQGGRGDAGRRPRFPVQGPAPPAGRGDRARAARGDHPRRAAQDPGAAADLRSDGVGRHARRRRRPRDQQPARGGARQPRRRSPRTCSTVARPARRSGRPGTGSDDPPDAIAVDRRVADGTLRDADEAGSACARSCATCAVLAHPRRRTASPSTSRALLESSLRMARNEIRHRATSVRLSATCRRSTPTRRGSARCS